MTTVYFTLILLLYYQYASSFRMEKVTLSKNKEYLRLQEQNEDYLQCIFHQEIGEQIEQVVWYHNNSQVIIWTRNKGEITVAQGINEDDIVLTRSDWQLQFANLNVKLAGIYRCEVITSKLETFKSPDYELLIVDMPHIETDLAKYFVKDCTINFSWNAPAVNPRPEPMCGIWSLSHSYIMKVPTFEATPYYNGSVAYNLVDEIFQIQNMPPDSFIRCELKLTKNDDTVIQLLEKKYKINEVLERGCPPIDVGVGISLDYKNSRTTCHHETIAKDETKPATVIVSCSEGYTPLFADHVTVVTLECQDQGWAVAEGQTWYHFDNMLCTLPSNDESENVIKIQAEYPQKEEISSGIERLMASPWMIILLLGVTISSGIIFGLNKGSDRKKDPKYMI